MAHTLSPIEAISFVCRWSVTRPGDIAILLALLGDRRSEAMLSAELREIIPGVIGRVQARRRGEPLAELSPESQHDCNRIVQVVGVAMYFDATKTVQTLTRWSCESGHEPGMIADGEIANEEIA